MPSSHDSVLVLNQGSNGSRRYRLPERRFIIQNHTRWTSIAAVVAVGLIGVLLLPTIGPAGPRDRGLLQHVLVTIEHSPRRLPDLGITGPGGVGINLVLLVVAVAVILLAPRLALLVVAVIICLPLLGGLTSLIRGGSPLSGDLPETLMVIGLLLAGVALFPRKPGEERRG